MKNSRGKNSTRSALGKYNVNEQIRSESIVVIDHNGKNLGTLSKGEALARAEEAELDLVQVGEKDGVPIAKFMDYGKFLYLKKKQLGDSKKHQKVVLLKEIKIRPQIGDQDYMTKLKRASGFFHDGNKVKFTLQFRGREATMKEELGRKLFGRIMQDLKDQGLENLMEEKESRSKMFWSKVFYTKK